jgi:hypothetical protein
MCHLFKKHLFCYHQVGIISSKMLYNNRLFVYINSHVFFSFLHMRNMVKLTQK